MVKKTIFLLKNIGNFQKMRLFKIPVKSVILQISEDLLFFSNLLHHEDHMSLEIWWENSFKKMLWQKNYDFILFSPKTTHDFR